MVLIRKGGPYNRSTLLLRHPDIFFVDTMMNTKNDFIPTPYPNVLDATLQQEGEIYSTRLTFSISMHWFLLHPFEHLTNPATILRYRPM
jgi:hypothetical protein